MATENQVKHGPFGDVADKNPERKVEYDTHVKKGDAKTGTNEPQNWGTHPSHTETAHPTKGDNFGKKP
jgi:hypothetical protein